MPSKALKDLNLRLEDIDRLLETNLALKESKKAGKAEGQTGAGEIVSTKTLGTARDEGKHRDVDAMNRAAFVLLSAHFQGFVEDLNRDLAVKLLTGKVANVDEIIKLSKQRNVQPRPDVIEKMFRGLGVFEVMKNIRWQRCSNDAIKERLKGYLQIRDEISHGAQLSVTRQKIRQYRRFVQQLAEALDEAVAEKAKKTHRNYALVGPVRDKARANRDVTRSRKKDRALNAQETSLGTCKFKSPIVGASFSDAS